MNICDCACPCAMPVYEPGEVCDLCGDGSHGVNFKDVVEGDDATRGVPPDVPRDRAPGAVRVADSLS